jgi:hypothetical protein
MAIMKGFKCRSIGVTMGGAVLLMSVLPAHAATLISEDFNDVTGLATATSVRTVSNILSSNPGQLPAGTLWASTNLLQGGPAADVNVRRTDNSINTTAGSTGFDSFFSPVSSANNFLVLGDQGDVVGGNPDGGLLGQGFAFATRFAVGAGGSPVSVSFDWAFDGTDNNNTVLQQDRFSVGIVGGTNLNLASFLSGNPTTLFGQVLLDRISPAGFGTGSVSSTVSLAQGDYWLVFTQLEALNGTGTNSAVGIDNINVSTVPVPAALPLLGAALAALSALSRRKV